MHQVGPQYFRDFPPLNPGMENLKSPEFGQGQGWKGGPIPHQTPVTLNRSTRRKYDRNERKTDTLSRPEYCMSDCQVSDNNHSILIILSLIHI